MRNGHGGRLAVEDDGLVVSAAPGVENEHLVALDSLNSATATLDPDAKTATVRLTWVTGRIDAYPRCEPIHEVDDFLAAICKAKPDIVAVWEEPQAPPPPPDKSQLRAGISHYSSQGYALVEQSENHAKLIKPKQINVGLLIGLLVLGLFIVELPLIAYLIYYFAAAKGRVVELDLDPATGQVNETHYPEGQPKPLRPT